MSFPIELIAHIDGDRQLIERTIKLYGPLGIIIGPNGSGKTHLMRALKVALRNVVQKKKVRFISAGRIGSIEQYRSDYDGHRGDRPLYEHLTFGSKNEGERRHLIETIIGDIQTLAERPDIQIKIQERLRKLFKRDVNIQWDGGNLKVWFNRIDELSQSYSAGREASGLLHLIAILTALYDDEVGAVLIDEPEVSLHPQLQAFLLREIVGASGYPEDTGFKKLVVIATHSTEMVRLRSIADLPSLVFCYDLATPPLQVSPEEPTLKSGRIRGLIARLGQTHKLALFARKPLLVEGTSDAIICQALANKLEMYPEAAGSQLLPTEGKEQIGPLVKLLRLLGKQPVVMVDADGFADGPDILNQFLSELPQAAEEATAIGAASAEKLASDVYQAFVNLIGKHWGSLEPHAIKHRYWGSDAPEDVRKRRSALVTILALDQEVLNNLEGGKEISQIRARLEALFGLCERCGLFVLRKGVLEDYFSEPVEDGKLDKPETAAVEAEKIDELSAIQVHSQFADIIRCMKFASHAEAIREAEALRDLLLAAVSPAQAHLQDGNYTQDFNRLAQQAVGDKAKIFDLTATSTQLNVGLNTKILDVDAFPIAISKDANVVVAVREALKLGRPE